MGSFLDEVNARGQSPEAVAHRAALFLDGGDRRVLVTEAGDDAFFYSALMRRQGKPKRDVGFYAARGRAKVVETLRVLQSLGKTTDSYAIIDRDFHFSDPEYMMDGHCLILQVYSYENIFADDQAITSFGRALFGLEQQEDEDLQWIKSVDNFFQSVSRTMLEQHALALWCRRETVVCNLNNFSPSPWIEVNDDGLMAAKPELRAEFLTRTGSPHKSDVDLADIIENLEGLDWKRWFRGHYFFQLMVKFFNNFRMWLDSRNHEQGKSRSRSKAALTERHVLEAGVSFLTVPESLKSFLNTILA